jgi:polyisoprenyl-phosphate glycosyltransferase
MSENHTLLKSMISIIIPCFNEEAVLPSLFERLQAAATGWGMDFEVICVDDGSRDQTWSMLSAQHLIDPRWRCLSFSRNFGHQAAVCAGIAHAHGDFVAVMDADLQDPPEFLATCLAKLQEGYDVVYAVRTKRKEGLFKRACYATFYRVLSVVSDIDMPLDSGDFCVMRQCVVTALRDLPERNVFVRGMRAWTGFRQIGVEYSREARAAGETKYPFRKLLRLAKDGVFSFSSFPLRLVTYFGFVSVVVSLIAGAGIAVWNIFNLRLFGHYPSEVPGWTSIVCLVLLLSGIQFLILGMIGEYIGRIHDEVKQRPRWIIRQALGGSAMK